MPLSQNFTASSYNRLFLIEEAEEKFLKTTGSDLLTQLGYIILDNKLEDIIGVRLLHRHNVVDEYEVMLEQEETDKKGRDCLSTIAAERIAHTEIAANSWMFGPFGFEAVEFSTDPKVRSATDAKPISEQFLNDTGKIIDAHNARGLLGLCVVPRSFYGKPRPKDQTLLVETTDDARRANVVRFDNPDNYTDKKLVPTSWVFKHVMNTEASGRIAMGCVKENCVPHTACVITDGSHSEQTHHSSQHRQTP